MVEPEVKAYSATKCKVISVRLGYTLVYIFLSAEVLAL